MVAGPFEAAASMDALVASLPPRKSGVKVVTYNVNGLRAAIRDDKGVALRKWRMAALSLPHSTPLSLWRVYSARLPTLLVRSRGGGP